MPDYPAVEKQAGRLARCKEFSNCETLNLKQETR